MNPHNLYLGAHNRPICGGAKTASIARQFCHVRGRGDNRRFFHCHGDQILFFIDDKVCGNAQRQLKSAYHVFDHTIGLLQTERSLPREGENLLCKGWAFIVQSF